MKNDNIALQLATLTDYELNDAIDSAIEEVMESGLTATPYDDTLDGQVLANSRDDHHPDPVFDWSERHGVYCSVEDLQQVADKDREIHTLHVEGQLYEGEDNDAEPTGIWWTVDIFVRDSEEAQERQQARLDAEKAQREQERADRLAARSPAEVAIDAVQQRHGEALRDLRDREQRSLDIVDAQLDQLRRFRAEDGLGDIRTYAEALLAEIEQAKQIRSLIEAVEPLVD